MLLREAFVIVASILGGILAIVIYILPTVLAFRRKHPSKIGIMVFNILLGWTFLGYLIALVWSIYSYEKKTLKRQV